MGITVYLYNLYLEMCLQRNLESCAYQEIYLIGVSLGENGGYILALLVDELARDVECKDPAGIGQVPYIDVQNHAVILTDACGS
jgi:hypothetical protein